MVLGVGELVDGVDALVCGLRLATLRSGDDFSGPAFAHREDIFLESFAKVLVVLRDKIP